MWIGDLFIKCRAIGQGISQSMISNSIKTYLRKKNIHSFSNTFFLLLYLFKIIIFKMLIDINIYNYCQLFVFKKATV